MKVRKKDSKVRVETEDKIITYDLKQWSEEKTLLTDEGVKKLPEWKLDLVKNHGVDLDDIPR